MIGFVERRNFNFLHLFFYFFYFLYILRGGLVYNDKKNTVVLEFVAPIVWIPFVAVKSALSCQQHALRACHVALTVCSEQGGCGVSHGTRCRFGCGPVSYIPKTHAR